MRRPALLLTALCAAVVLPSLSPAGSPTDATPSASARYQTTQPVGWGPRSTRAAAKLVHRNGFEPRPGNFRANHRVPPKRMLRAWRKTSEMPYKRFVNGRFRGTTDEIIQWSSLKWGIDTDTMRAVAAVESWWDMKVRGDDGDSVGLYQVRRPYHCRGACRIARYYTAFNADYYGAIIRSYFDGTQTWLNTVEGNGRAYQAGDLEGSLGAWYSGRWWGPPERPIQPYLADISQRRAEKIWTHPDFIAYDRG
ncbi:MAG TPA: hypothetical protein PKD76_07070 [Solirubrobacterales bacterium]|nr:hypothetical protein [Solirubrobacterales bacterium]